MVSTSSLLEYEREMFLDAFHEDGLLITSKGLGIDRILLNFIRVYSDPTNLVFVLNTASSEEEYFIEQLETLGIKPLPKVITNEYSPTDRQAIYLRGGVCFVTSRILVVDFLMDRVPVDHLSGILVYKAHKIIESGQEAFILRLYRQKNKTGFIKAFSDAAHAFTTGFCKVERVMKNLFVRNLYLWPRFQASVISCFDQHSVEVVEIQLQMTPAMVTCQTAILDLINACIKELKRSTTAVDIEEITVENALTRSFDRVLRLQMDPIWHQLGQKTRQIISDLKTLRLILRHLTQYDCVTFYSLVNSIKSNEKTFGSNSGWLFLDSADSLFVHAKQRVVGPPSPKKLQKGTTSKTTDKPADPVLEECPKWSALSDILSEIRTENADADGTSLGPGRTLIAAEDDRTCAQLRDYLCDGGPDLMARLYNKYLAARGAGVETYVKRPYPSKKGKEPMKDTVVKTTEHTVELTLTQMLGDKPDTAKDDTPPTSQDPYYGLLSSPETIIHPLRGGAEAHSLMKTLTEVQPRYVILYDADIQFVRQLEVFRATQPGRPLRVYFIMYARSTEEQRYLTSLRKEKEAFEYLIRQKATMVVPVEREGKQEDDPNLSRDPTPANATVNSRKGDTTIAQQKVIVDMREFRSELPSLIHRRGIDIEPVTLEVGDYILTPEMCVERKSVSDLIGSLNNGRLYNQAVAMCRFYKRPILLIEFDPNKSFSLQGKYQLSREVSIQDTISRLTLLTLHFPKLRILWCPSPYSTAELFEELKFGRPQPDADVAMRVSSTDSENVEQSDKYSHTPKDVLLRMPGVNSKNYHQIMNKVTDLSELSTLTEGEITEILGNSINGRLLWEFLHADKKTIVKSAANVKPTKSGPHKGPGPAYKGFKRKK